MHAIRRLLAIADEPADDDDLRLRKRVGVAAGLLTVIAPLTLPMQTQWHPLSWPLAFALSLFSVANLSSSGRSHRFERFVVAQISSGLVFVPLAAAIGGGIDPGRARASSGLPGAGVRDLALGPRRAAPWFIAFLAVVAVMASSTRSSGRAPPRRTCFQLASQVQNTVIPLTFTFLLLRYTDVRRRAAEARADELLTNAIPATIAARLRRGEDRIAEAYPETTVVFADIVGFTRWSQQTDPARIVSLLDDLFTRFDEATATAGPGEDQDDRRLVHGGGRGPVAAHRPCGGRRGAGRRDARGGGWMANRQRSGLGDPDRLGERERRGRRHRTSSDPVRPVGRHGQYGRSHGVIGAARPVAGRCEHLATTGRS